MGIMSSGISQWKFQRFANASFVVFGICLLCVFTAENGLSYDSLSELFASVGFKIYFLVTLVLACLNGVLAAWQIDGDYAKKFGIPTLLITTVSIIIGIFYLIYGLGILF